MPPHGLLKELGPLKRELCLGHDLVPHERDGCEVVVIALTMIVCGNKSANMNLYGYWWWDPLRKATQLSGMHKVVLQRHVAIVGTAAPKLQHKFLNGDKPFPINEVYEDEYRSPSIHYLSEKFGHAPIPFLNEYPDEDSADVRRLKLTDDAIEVNTKKLLVRLRKLERTTLVVVSGDRKTHLTSVPTAKWWPGDAHSFLGKSWCAVVKLDEETGKCYCIVTVSDSAMGTSYGVGTALAMFDEYWSLFAEYVEKLAWFSAALCKYFAPKCYEHARLLRRIFAYLGPEVLRKASRLVGVLKHSKGGGKGRLRPTGRSSRVLMERPMPAALTDPHSLKAIKIPEALRSAPRITAADVPAEYEKVRGEWAERRRLLPSRGRGEAASAAAEVENETALVLGELVDDDQEIDEAFAALTVPSEEAALAAPAAKKGDRDSGPSKESRQDALRHRELARKTQIRNHAFFSTGGELDALPREEREAKLRESERAIGAAWARHYQPNIIMKVAEHGLLPPFPGLTQPLTKPSILEMPKDDYDAVYRVALEQFYVLRRITPYSPLAEFIRCLFCGMLMCKVVQGDPTGTQLPDIIHATCHEGDTPCPLFKGRESGAAVKISRGFMFVSSSAEGPEIMPAAHILERFVAAKATAAAITQRKIVVVGHHLFKIQFIEFILDRRDAGEPGAAFVATFFRDHFADLLASIPQLLRRVGLAADPEIEITKTRLDALKNSFAHVFDHQLKALLKKLDGQIRKVGERKRVRPNEGTDTADVPLYALGDREVVIRQGDLDREDRTRCWPARLPVPGADHRRCLLRSATSATSRRTRREEGPRRQRAAGEGARRQRPGVRREAMGRARGRQRRLPRRRRRAGRSRRP
ncbi:hypothetical protein DFJ74DRAFT_668801 [Hyaloraphidium curvatum]|nr:hypothetical protein DFJ74DRAFT_668801 [Hyaloraphidium curvatum]